MSNLTESQRKIFDYVTTFIDRQGYSPTFREIQSHFGFASLGSVYNYVKVLKKKGLLLDQKNTGVTLPPKPLDDELNLPLLGSISAGFPIETFPQTQNIPVPRALTPHPEDTYIMRAKGDTLIDEHIVDGDLLLIEARTSANDGELIIGYLNQNEIIVKKYFFEGTYIRLESSDAKREPIILDPNELIIQGVVVGLIRSLY